MRDIVCTEICGGKCILLKSRRVDTFVVNCKPVYQMLFSAYTFSESRSLSHLLTRFPEYGFYGGGHVDYRYQKRCDALWRSRSDRRSIGKRLRSLKVCARTMELNKEEIYYSYARTAWNFRHIEKIVRKLREDYDQSIFGGLVRGTGETFWFRNSETARIARNISE